MCPELDNTAIEIVGPSPDCSSRNCADRTEALKCWQ
jgi:hypothetical protein